MIRDLLPFVLNNEESQVIKLHKALRQEPLNLKRIIKPEFKRVNDSKLLQFQILNILF